MSVIAKLGPFWFTMMVMTPVVFIWGIIAEHSLAAILSGLIAITLGSALGTAAANYVMRVNK